MREKSILSGLLVISSFILFSLFFGQSVVQADSLTDTAPAGLNFADYFSKGTVSPNNADTTSYKNGNTSIVQVTDNAESQKGYVWSNPDKANYIDLSRKQTLSMWIFLGNELNPGDGLAFVLQNYGLNAAARNADGTLVGGQSMGVWGPDESYKNDTTPADLAAKGIQNSWAMEFDTFYNGNNTGYGLFNGGNVSDANYVKNNSFDGMLDLYSTYKQHLANNYPGDSATYLQHSDTTANGSIRTYWYSMAHRNLKSRIGNNNKGLNLSNGMWHHIVYTYQPPETGSTIGHMSYTFDDKVVSSANYISKVSQPISDSNIEIDTSKFYSNPTQQFSKNDSKVLWGFTGSTGSNHARNMVVFESIPSIVEGSVSADIYDDSQNSKQLSSTDDTVYNGDNMRFVYNLSRDSGEQDWKDINSTINLPDNMTYNGGTISYNDGTTEDISASELSSGKYTKTIKDLLKSGSPNKATITINGTANSSTPKSDKSVASTKANFNGSNLLKETNLQGFTIKTTTMKLTPDSTELDLGKNDSITANATASYIDSSVAMDNSKVIVHYSLNGSSENMFLLSSGSDGKVALTLNKTDLNDGKNTLMVYVTDISGNRSNSVTFNINKPTKAPILIDADSNMSFRTVHSNGKTQLVKRNGDWKLNVIDNDDKSNWKLSATAMQAADSDTFDGDLLYVDNTGVMQSILNGSIVQIADKSTFPSNFVSDGTTYQVANTWTKDDGIILKSNSTAKAGNYKYDVTWDLTDSI